MTDFDKFFLKYALAVAVVGGLILYWMPGMSWVHQYSEQMRLMLSATPTILVITVYVYNIFRQLREKRDEWMEENQQTVKCLVSGAPYLISNNNNTDHPGPP